MYKEILELEEYCKLIGVKVRKGKLFDGYFLKFNNGGDVAQHFGTYGSKEGFVEFGFTGFSHIDFRRCGITEAKTFISRFKNILNKGVKV